MMKNSIIIWAISLLCLAANIANAQLVAPNLRCATKRFNGDIDLTWQIPTVNCGTLVGYRIYASLNNRQGVYSLLTTINNPATTTFTHVSANGNNSTWYYYVESEAGCAMPSAQSDTIDNQPPLPPDFKFVTVQNSQVVMEWERGADPETHAYIVYNTSTNQPIDTVFGRNNTTFTDINANPTNSVYGYTLIAMDSCFNAGIVNIRPHHTILLSTATNRCAQTVTLNWNQYDNWRNNVEHYQIWVSKNGGTSIPVDTVTNNQTTFDYTDFVDGDILCFEVKGVENVTHYTSVSNRVCVTGSIVQPARFVYLKNVSINPDEEVILTWSWNTNMDLANYGLNSSADNASYQRFSVVSAQLPLNASMTESVTLQPIQQQKFYYKIETIDSCQKTFFSNYASTIFLKTAALPNYQNQLTWTAYDNPLGTVVNYEVFRINPSGVEKKIATLDSNTLSLVNAVDPNEQNEQDICYYIVANVRVILPNGTIETYKSRSNKSCAHQEVQLFVPNAFAPDGVNSEFKPLAPFNATAQYYMAIYDRWGGIVFETNQIDTGWNGTKNGTNLPQGVYTYYIKAQEPKGKPIEKKGSVLLLR